MALGAGLKVCLEKLQADKGGNKVVREGGKEGGEG